MQKPIGEILLDILFPKQCVGCRRSGSFLCDKCVASIPVHTDQVCPICEKTPTPYGRLCNACFGASALDGLVVATPYRHHIISRSVHAYKYRFLQELHRPLGKLLAQAVKECELPLPDTICPVPLHPYRLRWRGFNQAQLLAIVLSNAILPHYPIPIEHLLKRIVFTAPQMSVQNKQERKHRLHHAFAINETGVEKKLVWLVDDVATTGATLEECARVLKEHGVQKVFGIVVAR